MKYTKQMDFNWFYSPPAQLLPTDVVNFYNPFRVSTFGIRKLMVFLYSNPN